MKTKYHPILFSTPMVQAIQENRKKQTRRTKGLEKINKNPDEWEFTSLVKHPIKVDDKNINAYFKRKDADKWMYVRCPYNVGDVLWVRETWSEGNIENGKHSGIRFKADDINYKVKWKPSLFMPKAACRTFLKIKSIRVERLQDISEEDAIAEGAKDRLRHSDLKVLEGLKDWVIPSPFLQHQFGFLAIWCTINGCDNWISNPFVWVYEFEKIDKPFDFGV